MTTVRTAVAFAWIAVSASAATLGACATDGTTPIQPVEADAARLPDAEPDAATDSGPCVDCEYFPETCSADTLCRNPIVTPPELDHVFDERTRIAVIRGRSANDIWAGGALGTLIHFDGTSWTVSDSATQERFTALWLRDSSEVALGIKSIFSRGLVDGGGASAGGWTAHTDPKLEVDAAWAGPGANWLWYAAPGGGLWRLRLSPPDTFEAAAGVDSARMIGLHGSSANAVWAVGPRGAAVRVTAADSDMPTVDAFNTQTWSTLRGVWAASDSEAWAVGSSGTICHYTGHPVLWDVVADVPTAEDLNAVWGSSTSDIWAVGNHGVVLHSDGKSWSRVKVAGLGSIRPDLFAVWAPVPGQVWIGGQGVILSLGGKP